MSLRIRRVKLVVSTLNGNYGTDLIFQDGLALLHKDNTRGKSTALKAIIYALGLERMFGPVDHPPLTPATTSRLKDETGEWEVIESWVYLEIENRNGNVATLRRKIAGEGGEDRKLISVWQGSVLDDSQLQKSAKPFYARDPGAATRDQGIYTFLADFIGWKLPNVLRYDGTQASLYMECLLSLFFVEQSQGWTAIQAVTPRYFQIRQVEKKAIEFILNLDACAVDTEHQKVEQKEDELRKEWLSKRAGIEALARSINGALRELPSEPQILWPPNPNPFIELYNATQTWSLSHSIQSDTETLQQLEGEVIPTVDQAASELKTQLDDSFRQLSGAELLLRDTREELALENANLAAIETRYQTMQVDLEHHKGEKKVRDLGFQNLHVAQGECPTCHQSIDDTLLKQGVDHQVMTLDENIALIEAQMQTLEKMRARTGGAIEALERRVQGVENYIDETSAKIRSVKRTLVSAGSAPSEAAVRERLILEERLRQRLGVLHAFEQQLAEFGMMAERWREIQARKKELKAIKTSVSDRKKLDRFEELMLGALSEFGFESFPVEAISLDRESYKPTRQGFDVLHDVSASDNIRVIAAYLTALLEVCHEFSTNHPGLLILDEPRQQNMKWSNFAKILSRLSACNKRGQQVIVATSDPPDRLAGLGEAIMSGRVDVEFESRLLQKM